MFKAMRLGLLALCATVIPTPSTAVPNCPVKKLPIRWTEAKTAAFGGTSVDSRYPAICDDYDDSVAYATTIAFGSQAAPATDEPWVWEIRYNYTNLLPWNTWQWNKWAGGAVTSKARHVDIYCASAFLPYWAYRDWPAAGAPTTGGLNRWDWDDFPVSNLPGGGGVPSQSFPSVHRNWVAWEGRQSTAKADQDIFFSGDSSFRSSTRRGRGSPRRGLWGD
jgi:hypothetical protein